MELEVTASASEYEAALRGEIDFPGISNKDLMEAKEHLARYVQLKLNVAGIKVEPEIQRKMVNILLLTIKKA